MVENCNSDDKLLIIDDIFDSGRSIAKVIQELKTKMCANIPAIKITVVFYKPPDNKTSIIPDYYCTFTDKWLVFPHDVEDMDLDEIASIFKSLNI